MCAGRAEAHVGQRAVGCVEEHVGLHVAVRAEHVAGEHAGEYVAGCAEERAEQHVEGRVVPGGRRRHAFAISG